MRTAESEISSPPALVVSPENSNVAVCGKPPTKNTQDKNIHEEESIIMKNIMSESLDDTAMNFKLLLSEMKAIRAEMRLFHNSMTDLMTAIKIQSSRIDSIETRISVLEDKSKGLQRCEVSTLEETMSQLKSQILERDQDLLANDIQIAGFPETSSENTAHIILAIAKKLCVDLDERDVVLAVFIVRNVKKLKQFSTSITCRPVKDLNVLKFNSDVDAVFWEELLCGDVNSSLTAFNAHILYLFNIHAPIRTSYIKCQSYPWITPTIKEMMKLRDKSHAKCKGHNSKGDKNIIKI
ncbi:unnamed protein product [Parnassius apollo]|uniref:(apollo) hypothetical protein n=1 Tax=Parnassius apollo TaxID=110799 RepID=A0A8S3XSG3_PARAO|nr:unnamed protein product [Parnassius apollo]